MGKPNQATKLSRKEAKEKIALFLKEGSVRPTAHCNRDSMSKRNVSIQDIIHVLQNGEINQGPKWSDDYNEWKYLIDGTDLEGDDLRAGHGFFLMLT